MKRLFGAVWAAGLFTTACTTWSGDLNGASYTNDEKKLVETSYPHAVYVELPKITDNDADKDFTPAIPEASRGFQQVMVNHCANKHLFAACVTQPSPNAFVISTDVTVVNYRPGNFAGAFLGGLLFPPVLGMAWSFPVFLGDFDVNLSWTMKDPQGQVLSTWTSHADTDSSLDDERFAFLQDDGFPKFLENASQSMIARLGPPQVAALAMVTANQAKAVEPVHVEPAKPKRPGAVVAVFDVQDASGKLHADLLDQLTEYLAAQIVEVARYRVVPRNQLRSRLSEEKKETYKSCYDESCQIELGKAVAAEKSLQTKLLRVGSSCAITATLYDLKSETTDLAGSVDGDCSENGLMGNMRRLAEKLAANR